MSKFDKVTDIETPSTKFEQWLVELNEELKRIHESKWNTEYEDLEYKLGQKYARIVMVQGGSRSVWGFVAMKDIRTKTKSFQKGDLLKAAGWKGPAKHARGNIFEGTGRYTLYGPEYLK